MKLLKLLFYILFISFSIVSCVTYQKCKDKFGVKTDSTYITLRDTVRIPKDSLVTVFKTVDSKRIIDTIIRQGRVTVRYKQTPVLTYIRADCDTVTRYLSRTIKIPVANKFGVNPFYKRGFWIVLILLIIIITLIYYVFSRKNTKSS